MAQYEKTVKISGYDDFHCTANQCVDYCCHGVGWLIYIDEKTYEKYKALKTDFGTRILERISKKEVKPGKEMYVMELDETNTCSFSKNCLCEIQLELGEKYLSRTCRIYPRLIKKYNHLTQFSLTLSCSEVVKLLLMNEKQLTFETGFIKRSMLPFKTKWIVPEEIKTGLSSEKCAIVRDSSISILQNRSISLWQRIAYLGLFSRADMDDPAKVAAYYMDNVNSENVIEALNRFTLKDSSVRNDLISAMMGRLPSIFRTVERASRTNSDMYRRVVDVFLNVTGESKPYFSLQRIEQLKADLFDPYIRANEHVFENYLVAEMFNLSYPVKNTSVYNAYSSLIVKYIFLQTFIIMVYHDKKVLTGKEVINCVYYFSKFIDHNESKTVLIEYITAKSASLTLSNLISLVMY